METFVLFIHIVVCALLVIVVLLQSGKSADLAGAFGGAGSQSTFGPRGAASFLSKMTTTLAILFMVTSLSLYIIAANKGNTRSVMKDKDDVTQEETTGDKVDKKEAGTEAKDAGTEAAKPAETTGETPAATADTEKKDAPKAEDKKTETPTTAEPAEGSTEKKPESGSEAGNK
ncbi:MAG: preprotein translocase subunit SecG [bacterium]|nr:preprotein translocase subunit SecG [bacterium]